MPNINAGNRRRKPIEEVINTLLEYNIKLLSTEYINNKMLLDVECLVDGCGHKWETTLEYVRRGVKLCIYHGEYLGEKITNEFVDNYLIENNIQFKRLEEVEYTKIKYKWKCLRCGLIVSKKFKNFRYHNTKQYGCKGCLGATRRITNEEYDKRLLDNNISIIRVEDLKAHMHQKVNHKCLECGDVFKGIPSNIQSRHNGCPTCAKSKYEKFTGSILNSLFPNLVNSQYKVLANKRVYFIDYELEINGKQYFIEYNGKQHYEACGLFGGERSFTKQQKRDQELIKYCKVHNIELIEIKYDLSASKIEELLYSIFLPIKGNLGGYYGDNC